MSDDDKERRRQKLAQMFDTTVQVFAKNKPNSAPPKLNQLKEFAETLRKELERDLEYNEELWTERSIRKTLNDHMNKTIEDHSELLEELNKLMEEEEENGKEKEDNH